MYKFIEPEVAGGLGKGTVIISNVHPPIVKKLNYEFDGWLGDDILESFPCCIVSERLKDRLVLENLSGIKFEDVTITKSERFYELFPVKELPKFYWAKIVGKKNVDDFYIGEDLRIVISERAYEIIGLFNVSNALFENVQG